MQSPVSLQVGFRRPRIAAAVAACLWFWLGPTDAEGAPGLTGVVLETVGEGSALGRAGLEPGDIVLSWERAVSPAHPRVDRGRIDSVFDWTWLELEQAPRGPLRLTVERNGEPRVFEIAPGRWDASLRARMTEAVATLYANGRERIEKGELEDGVDLWRQAAERAGKEAAQTHIACWLDLRIAEVWGEAERWEKVREAFALARATAPDASSRAAVFEAMGLFFEKVAEVEEAREAFTAAREIRETIGGDSLAVAWTLYKLGRLDYSQRLVHGQDKLHSTRSWMRRALEIVKRWAPQSLRMADILYTLGVVGKRTDDLDRAAEHLGGALRIYQQRRPDSLEVARCWNDLGNVAHRGGDPDRAAGNYERALRVAEKAAPEGLMVAGILSNLGIVALERGHLVEAASYHERSLEIRRGSELGTRHVPGSLLHLGTVAASRGDLGRAAEYFELALERRKELSPGRLLGVTHLINLSQVALKREDLPRAAEYLSNALEIQRKLAPDRGQMAHILLSLGRLARKRGDLEPAAHHLERALSIWQKVAPDSLSVADGLHHLGLVAARRGDPDRATEFLKEALAIHHKHAPEGLGSATSLYHLGSVAFGRGDLERAAQYLEQSLQIRQRLAPRSVEEAAILHHLALLRHREGHPEEALGLHRRALVALESQIERLGGSRDAQAVFRASHTAHYHDAIEVALELGRPEEAFHMLERFRARGFLDQLAERDLIWSDVPEELGRQRRSIVARYERTQNEIARLDPTQQAGEIEALLETLRGLRRQLEDVTEEVVRTSPRLESLRYPEPLEFDAARRALDPGTVMLAYNVDPTETRLFVLAPGEELRFRTLPVGEKALRSDVQKILELQATRSAAAYKEPLIEAGARLYRSLIEPVEPWIAHSERLLLVPDGPLHLLPFALLVRERGAQEERRFEYLVEWKPIHSTLSATVYAELARSRRTEQERGPALTLAAFGDPRYALAHTGAELLADRGVDIEVRSAAALGFPFRPLPYSREEVRRIAAFFPEGSVRTYLGGDASEERAKAVGKEARILHFATHGRYDSRMPLNSYLALSLPEEFRDGRDNGLLQAWEIFERVRLDADLVVLSACDSGLGEELRGEGLIGLTRAFQFAGARSVIATLWQVSDQATAELMASFYRHLEAGQTKDQALRSAQLELLREVVEVKTRQGRSVKRDFSLPYYWAAFQINGDWR